MTDATGNPARVKNLSKYRTKYNRPPFNPQQSQIPAHERRMALIHVRSVTRSILANKHDSGELQSILARFMLSHVRGDAVPTLADGYAALIDTVNAAPLAEQLNLPMHQLNTRHLKIRVRVEVLNPTTNQWEEA